MLKEVCWFWSPCFEKEALEWNLELQGNLKATRHTCRFSSQPHARHRAFNLHHVAPSLHGRPPRRALSCRRELSLATTCYIPLSLWRPVSRLLQDASPATKARRRQREPIAPPPPPFQAPPFFLGGRGGVGGQFVNQASAIDLVQFQYTQQSVLFAYKNAQSYQKPVFSKTRVYRFSF